MFGLGFAFDMRTAQERRRDAIEDERIKHAKEKEPVAWDPKMRFQPSLHIQGDTYNPPSLFKVRPCPINNANDAWRTSEDYFVLSPNETWGYREAILPEGEPLRTFTGNRRGVIVFDTPVKIPSLIKRYESGSWNRNPWMSLAPMEIFSLRPGTRMAKGHTVVAGLGMGHQLSEVCKKRSVTRVTLVEESQELVDWILPRVELHGKKVDVVVGDAYKLVPPMECDVALIDIFPRYSGNLEIWTYRTEHKPVRAKKVWIWGSCSLG